MQMICMVCSWAFRLLEEEKVLEGMKIIEGLLKKEGRGYELIPF